MSQQINNENWKNVAMVVSHPAHLIMVAGMVQRYRPKFLIISESAVQQSIVRYGFSLLGLEDHATFLELPDAEAYESVLAGDYSLYFKLGETIYDWLNNNKPEVVFGDAYELSNFQHDVTRLLLDHSLRRFRLQNPNIQNFEIPICCRTTEGTGNALFQTFPFGEYETFTPNEFEATIKNTIAEWACQQDDFIAKVCKLVPGLAEPYRNVPWDRDYTQPPKGLKKHYDERGWEEVTSKHYEEPILFEKHFVPLANALQM